MDWEPSHSYAAADIYGVMGCEQKIIMVVWRWRKLLSGPYPTTACPEFHVGCRLDQELFTLLTYTFSHQWEISINIASSSTLILFTVILFVAIFINSLIYLRFLSLHSSVSSNRSSGIFFSSMSCSTPRKLCFLCIPLLLLTGGFHLNAYLVVSPPPSHDQTIKVLYFALLYYAVPSFFSQITSFIIFSILEVLFSLHLTSNSVANYYHLTDQTHEISWFYFVHLDFTIQYTSYSLLHFSETQMLIWFHQRLFSTMCTISTLM